MSRKWLLYIIALGALGLLATAAEQASQGTIHVIEGVSWLALPLTPIVVAVYAWSAFLVSTLISPVAAMIIVPIVLGALYVCAALLQWLIVKGISHLIRVLGAKLGG